MVACDWRVCDFEIIGQCVYYGAENSPMIKLSYCCYQSLTSTMQVMKRISNEQATMAQTVTPLSYRFK
ncbi:hypothetical protein O9993_23425 [Vibrio lentus]|nr:hypothetical protein [Vibrio lentus]